MLWSPAPQHRDRIQGGPVVPGHPLRRRPLSIVASVAPAPRRTVIRPKDLGKSIRLLTLNKEPVRKARVFHQCGVLGT